LPFELNPQLPPEGRNRREYLTERFGNPNPFAKGQQQLLDIGRELGIDFRFESIERAPSTRRAHALAAAALQRSPTYQAEIIRGLFEAYFTAGRDVGDPETLIEIGVRAGLSDAEASAALDDPQRHAQVVELESLAALEHHGCADVHLRSPARIFRRTAARGVLEGDR